MTDRIRRLYEMYLRVSTFMTTNADDFSDVPFVKTAAASLQSLTGTLGTLGAAKITMTAASKDSTASRGDARESLRDYLEYIAEVWRFSYDEAGGDENMFRVPAGNNDQNLIASGKAFAAALPAHKQIFIDHGLPDDVIAQLQSRTDAFEQAVLSAGAARGERVGTNAAFDEPARQAKRLVDKLSPTVKRKYRDNPQKLAEWLVAVHLAPQPKSSTAASKSGDAAAKQKS